MLSLVLLCVEGQVECQKCGGFSFAFAVELDYRCWRKCFISPTSQIEFNTKNKSHAPSNLGFIFAAIISIFWKFVTLFLLGISLLVLNSIIDVEESVSFLRYRQSSWIPKINSLLSPNLGFGFAAIITRSFGNLLPYMLWEKTAIFFVRYGAFG